MFNIKTANKIAKIGLDNLDRKIFAVDDNAPSPDGIVVRSANLNDTVFEPNLLAIARAGAGVNNIPVADCAKQGIVVFNTPGANANAVRELAVCALFLASRDVFGGMMWAKGLSGDDVPAQVEKGKSKFVGPEIDGKTLGVIGLGAIGVGVANAAHHLGMSVIGYDPYISVDAAWGLSRNVKKSSDLKALLAECDYISIHVPLNAKTKYMINAESLAGAKDGLRIINLARGELVSDDDIIAAAASGKVARYVTDFPNAKLLACDKVVPVPHLGASTPESEDNCAVMACRELSDYLLCGNIRNSVNFPDVELPLSGEARISVLHTNTPNVLSKISEIFGGQSMNISNMVNKSKGEFAYTLLDVDAEVPAGTEQKLREIAGVLRVRIIKP